MRIIKAVIYFTAVSLVAIGGMIVPNHECIGVTIGVIGGFITGWFAAREINA